LEVRNKISNEISAGTETIAKLYIQNNQDEHRIYEVFFDKVYGTFAVQDPSKANQGPVSPGTKGQKPVHVKSGKAN
jgi:hypothetical protein